MIDHALKYDPVRPNDGVLIVVVGPSGAGKDRLIDHARRKLSNNPSVLFVRRVVTRTSPAVAEDHDCLSPEQFSAAQAAGQFAVCWEAHGLRYGIPSSVRGHLERGGVALINGSRAALPAICSAFGRVLVIHITAPPDVLARRLAKRGRESMAEMKGRLKRASLDMPDCVEAIEIDNGGAFHVAAAAFLETIRKATAEAGIG
jgi:ribose 1,5-bisphosphokinase